MKWFSNLFNKNKTSELSTEELAMSKRKWEGFDYFEKGQDCYVNRQISEALTYLDKALENGFAENFSHDASTLYDLRAGCLQELEFHYDAINEFDKSISLEPNDCNKFFRRALSKSAILDFEGEVADLKKAIQLSKIDNALNREYNDEAQKQGRKNGVVGMFVMSLQMAEIKLFVETKEREQVDKAATPKDKEFLQKKKDERREKRLSQIKRRNV